MIKILISLLYKIDIRQSINWFATTHSSGLSDSHKTVQHHEKNPKMLPLVSHKFYLHTLLECEVMTMQVYVGTNGKKRMEDKWISSSF